MENVKSEFYLHYLNNIAINFKNICKNRDFRLKDGSK